jgi:transcriptional regulator GlxA family with amidase domain
MTEETQNNKDLLRPKSGTASSSPLDNTASHIDMNIVNTMLWMQKNAYEPTTIKKVAKLLRHLQRKTEIKNHLFSISKS